MENAKVASDTRGISRIRDVILNADRLSVRAKCNFCGYASEFEWSALALGYGEGRSLWALARSIRCKRCGARGCVWQVTDTEKNPPGPQPPAHGARVIRSSAAGGDVPVSSSGVTNGGGTRSPGA